MPRVFQIALLPVLLAVLGIAAAFSLYLGWADYEFRRGTPESVAAAVRLRPSNTRYLLMQALQADYEGADARPLLERAAALNPLSSAPRIRLGLAAETQGDFATAERWYVDAAKVDHQFEPSWTLANFYFRQGRREEFFPAMRKALAVSYGDRRAAFELCSRMTSDPAEVLDKAIPDQRQVLAGYLYFLLDRLPEVDAQAGAVSSSNESERQIIKSSAARLLRIATPAERPSLYAACDRLINLRDAAGARTLWMELGEPDPKGVTNGDFHRTPSERGFDWRLVEGVGIVHSTLDYLSPQTARTDQDSNAGDGHRIRLTGQQRESTDLLWQVVRLDPGKRYRISWEGRTSAIGPAALGAASSGPEALGRSSEEPESERGDARSVGAHSAVDTGLAWKIEDHSFAIEPSSDWSRGSGIFEATEELTRLTLLYQRPSGQVRAEGSLDVKTVSITEVEGNASEARRPK